MRKPAIRTTAMPTSGNSHRIQADFSRACIRVNGNNSADFEARKAAVVVEPATVQETPLTPKDCAEFIWAGAGPNQEVHLCFRLLSQISSASYSAFPRRPSGCQIIPIQHSVPSFFRASYKPVQGDNG